jgi:hypothetical protein
VPEKSVADIEDFQAKINVNPTAENFPLVVCFLWLRCANALMILWQALLTRSFLCTRCAAL